MAEIEVLGTDIPKDEVYSLDFLNQNSVENLANLLQENNSPEVIEYEDNNGNKVYLVKDEETNNYHVIDEETYKEYEKTKNTELLEGSHEVSSEKLADSLISQSSDRPSSSIIREPEYQEEHEEKVQPDSEEIAESSYGDFIGDIQLLATAYESVLDMRMGIRPCLNELEYSNISFPGEALGGQECSSAKISKPEYTRTISGAFASAKGIAVSIESKINELVEVVSNQIETFKAEQSEAAEILDFFLMMIASEKLESYIQEGNTNALIENIDILPEEYIQYLVGQMNEEQYDEFISGIENYYGEQIGSLEKMQQVNEEVLGSIYTFLNSVGDFDKGILSYDMHIESDFGRSFAGYKWSSYEDAAAAGYSGIMTEDEYKRRNPTGDYSEYLRLQEEKSIRESTPSYAGKLKYLEEINQKIAENQELKDLGITSFDELMNEKAIEEQKKLALHEGILNLTNIKGSAKYDYLSFKKDYSDFQQSGEYNLNSPSLLEDIESFNKKYPGLIIGDNPDSVVAEALGKYGIKTWDELNQIKDDIDLFEASKYDTSFAQIYAYLYNKDPSEAHQYKEAIQYKINNIEGQVKANEFLEKWMKGEDIEHLENGVINSFIVNVKGLVDGVVSFGEGLGYVAEALGMKENRIHSAEEYERMYILQALSSTGEKEKLGLISNGLNNLEVNPYSIIDYTKEYAGKWLDEKYQLSQGIGNMLPSIILSTTLAPTVGSIALGLSSGGNAFHSMMVEGYDYWRAVTYGVLSGSTEAITERYLGGLPGLSETEVVDAKSWLIAALKEGNEEVYQDFMDLTFRSLSTGEKIELPNSAEELIEFAKNEFKTWSFGAITAGIMQSPSLVNLIKSQAPNNTRISNEDMMGKVDLHDLAKVLLEPTMDLYKKAQEIANNPTFKQFLTYRTHTEGHVKEVAFKTLEAALAIQQTVKANKFKNFSSHINLYDCFIAAIWHDTGMSGGLDSYVDENGEIKTQKLVDKKEGGTTRSNHSFNSAMNVLMNADTISQLGVDPNIIALLCFSHSKSNSGVSTLNGAEDWSLCISKIENAVKYCNDNPIGKHITFANGKTSFVESLVDSGVLKSTKAVEGVRKDKDGNIVKFNNYQLDEDMLGQLASSAFALRLGDANTNNRALGTNQGGKEIKLDSMLGSPVVSFNTDAFNGKKVDYKALVIAEAFGLSYEDALKAKESKSLDFFNTNTDISMEIGDERYQLSSGSVAYILGENNLDFKTYANSNNELIEQFTILDPTAVPGSTLFCIDERIGEVKTATNGNFRAYLEIILNGEGLSEAKKSEIEEYYTKFMKKTGYKGEVKWSD